MKDQVSEALELLIGGITQVERNVSHQADAARKKHNYGAAKRLQGIVTKIAKFKQRVTGLQADWASTTATMHRRAAKPRHTRKSRLGPGLRTPEREFRKPILEALVELGGKAPVTEVLNRVGEKMKAVLTEYDYKPLPSDPKSIRWHCTAQWCRKKLVLEGLMKSDTPRGIWEISDLGREALRNEKPQ